MRIGRRSGAAAALVVGVGLVSACSPAAEGGDGSGGEVQNPEVLTVATDDEPESLDPAAVADNGLGRSAVLAGYDRLLDIDPGGTDLIPSVAAEVPTPENGGISEDGLTYTFTLRDDVQFHDGSDLTAEDVVYSWERVMTMDLPEGQAEIFETIESMSAPDDTTFVVQLREVAAPFLYDVVASMPASIVNPDVVEANGGVEAGTPNEWMAQNMAGSGQYVLESWQRGERITFEINEKAQEDLRWFNVQDPNVYALGLRAGDYDIIEGIPTIIPDVEGAPGVVVNPDTPGLQLLQIGFNMNIPEGELPEGDTVPADFFHDKRVRQAFNHAFNYEAMNSGPLSGAATRGSYFIPEGMYGHDPDAPKYEYDLAEAERLFTEAGWWDEGFTVSLIAEEDSVFADQSLILKDGIEALNPNFRVNVMALPEARFDEIMATQPIPAAMWSWTTPEFRDPHAYFMDSAHPDGRWGTLAGLGQGYENPDEVASLIQAAYQELDSDARAEIYAELQQVMYDEAPSILPAQENIVLAYRDWLDDVVANPMWPRPGLRYSLYSKGDE
jgi:peptide/nickel transport system substrate-binding protein